MITAVDPYCKREESIMFDIFCPVEKLRVLLSASDILRIERTDKGIEIHYRCPCGHEGTLQTGRK
jgi:hypothetical protein